MARKNTLPRFFEDIVDDTKDFVDDLLDRAKDLETDVRDTVSDTVSDAADDEESDGDVGALKAQLAELTAKVNQLTEMQQSATKTGSR